MAPAALVDFFMPPLIAYWVALAWRRYFDRRAAPPRRDRAGQAAAGCSPGIPASVAGDTFSGGPEPGRRAPARIRVVPSCYDLVAGLTPGLSLKNCLFSSM